MFDYPALMALATVIRLGSFEAAAQALGVTQSAVSQRIKTLEERMGTALVIRGQPCRGTEAGARLAHHAEDVQLLEQRTLGDLGAPTPMAPARIAVNADSLATWFPGAMAACPHLLFDLEIDDQEHSADWLRRGEVAAAVSAHPGAVRGCDSTALGALRYIATASPAYIERWLASGVTTESLGRAPAITYSSKDRLQLIWSEMATGTAVTAPSHMIGSSQGFVEMALAGIGWGMNPEPLIRDHLARGDLVPLLPDLALDVALYWQVSRLMAEALAPLSRAVLQQARAVLVAP